jgi:hypothetical protein
MGENDRSIALLIPILCALFSCTESVPPTEVSPDIPPSVDTNWVTSPQMDLYWPGLANSPWPMFLHDPQHTGRSPYRGPQEGKVEWLFDAGYNVYSSPAIDIDGGIYFSVLLYNFFYSVTPSGGRRWRSSGGGGDGSPLIGSDGTIYISGQAKTQPSSALLSYDGSGNLKWEYLIEGRPVLASPAMSYDGETIYIVSKYLYAIRKDGTLGWKRLPSDSSDSGFQYSPGMSPDGSTLYVPAWNALYAMDTSGAVKWQFGCRTPGTPAVDNDGNVYFVASPSNLYSLSRSGAIRWMRTDIIAGGFDSGPVIGRDGTIYIAGQALHAVDYAGKLKWKYGFTTVTGCIPAIDSAGTLYVGGCTTRTPADSINFFAINPNGTLKFGMSLRSPDGSVPDIDSRPAISADGKIYVGSDRPRGDHLYKIQ